MLEACCVHVVKTGPPGAGLRNITHCRLPMTKYARNVGSREPSFTSRPNPAQYSKTADVSQYASLMQIQVSHQQEHQMCNIECRGTYNHQGSRREQGRLLGSRTTELVGTDFALLSCLHRIKRPISCRLGVNHPIQPNSLLIYTTGCNMVGSRAALHDCHILRVAFPLRKPCRLSKV